jgi:hypothetical protein
MRLPFRSLWLALGLAFLTVSSAILAYYRIFTGFAEWDDEGMLMMTVRQFLTGGTLYENIHTGYGPVYYFANWLLRTLTFTGVTHDTTRMTSMVIWTLCALACAWIVWRFSGSVVASLLAHVLVFRSLSFFVNEPGHPQELCTILLIALAATGLAVESPRWRTFGIALSGILPAALLLVKVNIGIFAIAAVSLTMILSLPRSPLAVFAKWLAGAGALMLPFLLMRTHLSDPSEIAYCVAVSAGIAALFCSAASPTALVSWWDCAIAAIAFACTCVVLLGALWIQGVSLSSVLSSLVLQHIRVSVTGNWFLPVSMGGGWMLWALAGPTLALFAARRQAQSALPSLPSACALAALGSVALLLAALDSSRGNRSSQLLGFIAPFCWVVILLPGRGAPARSYSRILLATVTVFQALYAYPVAGSQGLLIRILPIVVAAIVLADSLQYMPPSLREGAFARSIAIALAACVLISYPAQAWRARQVYFAATPLNLPGARKLHLAAREAEVFQWLVSQLNRHCDIFVGYPGIPSLYIWTNQRMPGPARERPGQLNADAWTIWFTPPQQQVILADFAPHTNSCVVYHPSGVSFWNPSGVDERAQPLVDFVRNQFRTVDAMGDYQLQIRKERPWPDPALR